jgi:hypothetical protein
VGEDRCAHIPSGYTGPLTAHISSPEPVVEPDPDPEIRTCANMVYTLGLSRNNVRDVLAELGIKATLVSKPDKADFIIVVTKRETQVSKYRDRAVVIPIKSNSRTQIQNVLSAVMKK